MYSSFPLLFACFLAIRVQGLFTTRAHLLPQTQFSTCRLFSDLTSSTTDEEVRAHAHPLPPTSTIAGFIFDMDGTITQHCIDFSDLRRRVYEIADDDLVVYEKGCVLELAEKMSPEGNQRAQEVFRDIQQKAIQNMQLNDGLVDLCQFLDQNKIKRAVLTRNVLTSVVAMHELLEQQTGGVGRFHPSVCRDSTCVKGLPIPSKPFPDAILHICGVWGCNPSEVLMIGDSQADDMVAAYRAGCCGRILLAEGGQVQDTDLGVGGPQDQEEANARSPDVAVSSLLEFRDLLQQGLQPKI